MAADLHNQDGSSGTATDDDGERESEIATTTGKYYFLVIRVLIPVHFL